MTEGQPLHRPALDPAWSVPSKQAREWAQPNTGLADSGCTATIPKRQETP